MRPSTQADLFAPARRPVMAAWGAGVDSTAMLVEMIARHDPVDIALFADTGSEQSKTYEFIPVFRAYLTAHGVPSEIVRYEPTNFKNYPPYRTLEENCLTNGTLPSKAFGFGTCSSKWKIQPQDKFADSWMPAREAWAAGLKVMKLIGYDCSPADQRRYAEREGHNDPRYDFRYPLREWGWTRDDCKARILRAGLPLPPKSACFFCPATKPHELHTMPAALLRRIVLMEARAMPRLRNVEGLWRKSVKGLRGATPRPGSMTEYIRQQGLLPTSEIHAIITSSPKDLVSWQERIGKQQNDRPDLRQWLHSFDQAGESGAFNATGLPPVYATEDAACT